MEFKVGDHVRVKYGMYEGYVGTVKKVGGKSRSGDNLIHVTLCNKTVAGTFTRDIVAPRLEIIEPELQPH